MDRSLSVRRLTLWVGPMLLALANLAAPQSVAAQEADGFAVDPYARLELGVVSSQSSDRDEELIVNGDGGYLRAQVGVDIGNDTSNVRFEADRIEVQRFGSATGRDAYNRDRLTAAYTQKLGEAFEVELQGRLYDDLVSIESSDTDERQASVQLEYEPERAHRFRLRGTWRDREYDDGQGAGGASSTGEGPRVDFDYRHRLGRYHYVAFDLRAEEIDSANPLRAYTRESAGASYTRPITRDLRVRPAVEVRHTRFDGRLTPAAEVREDTQIVPEVELLYWRGNWRIEAEAKYIFGSSNDPVREREGHRLSLSIGYVF